MANFERADDLCAVCSNKLEGSENFIPLYDANGEKLEACKCLEGILNLPPGTHHSSNKVCEICFTKIKDAYKARENIANLYQKSKDNIDGETFSNSSVVVQEGDLIDTENDTEDMIDIVVVEEEEDMDIVSDDNDDDTGKKKRKDLSEEWSTDPNHQITNIWKTKKVRTKRSAYAKYIQKLKNSVYKCLNCTEIFHKQTIAFTHVVYCLNGPKFSCSCGVYLRNHSNVNVHLGECGVNPAFICEICKKYFATEARLTAHMVIHTENKPFKCSHCDSSFRHKSTLDYHERRHNGDQPYKCQFCPENFSRPNFYIDHMRLYHPDDMPYECKECGLKFMKQFALDKHFNQKECASGRKKLATLARRRAKLERMKNISEKEMKKIQNKMKYDRTYRNRRKQIVEAKKSKTEATEEVAEFNVIELISEKTLYRIKVAPGFVKKYFADLESQFNDVVQKECVIVKTEDGNELFIQSSKLDVKADKLESYDAPKANVKYLNKEVEGNILEIGIISEHLYTNKVTAEFSLSRAVFCEICRKTLFKVHRLNAHYDECHKEEESDYSKTIFFLEKLASDEDLQYTCSVCPAKFANESLCKAHISYVHNCSLCSKFFKRRAELIRHKATHSGLNKKYPCELCGSLFSDKNYLEVHARKHTREEPFSCEYCNKRFKDPNHFKYHIRSHTEQPSKMCNYCGKGFYKDSLLKRHLLTHTGKHAFVCTRCKKGFSETGLKYHLLHSKSECATAVAKTAEINSVKSSTLVQDMVGRPTVSYDQDGGATVTIHRPSFDDVLNQTQAPLSTSPTEIVQENQSYVLGRVVQTDHGAQLLVVNEKSDKLSE